MGGKYPDERISYTKPFLMKGPNFCTHVFPAEAQNANSKL